MSESKMARVALVTGGTRGIGSAVCCALKAAGYKVAANYGSNDQIASSFHFETDIPIYKWDVGDFHACEKGIARIRQEMGSIDILVNNAGITKDSMLHKMNLESWSQVMRTNLDSLFNMTRTVIEDMRIQHFGRIISISSINGQKGERGQTNYAAAKAGMIGFTKALALESAPKGITVNAIAPGYVGTDMVRAVAPEILEKHILPQIPMGRLGEADEIARCVVFLAAEESSWITGATLSINGGQYMI